MPSRAAKPWLDDGDLTLYHGDALAVLQGLPSGIAQTCVTSPPYWGLRDYGTGTWIGGDPSCDHRHETEHQKQGATSQRVGRSNTEEQRNENYRDVCGKCGAQRTDDQLGLEASPDQYVERMVAVFREVRRVLRDDGTLWLNLGDSYASSSTYNTTNTLHTDNGWKQDAERRPNAYMPPGLKPKDLVGIPWRVAFALQNDGWYLRSDIIWAKPNPMPESVTDRPTKSHEYLFLFAKQPRYFYDADAIREPSDYPELAGKPQRVDYVNPAKLGRPENTKGPVIRSANRNRRSVWTIPTEPFPEAHFATYPQALVTPCIQAGTSSVGQCRECGRTVIPSEYAIRSSTNTPEEVRGVRDGVPADKAGDSVLLEAVQLGSNGSATHGLEGLVSRSEGLHPDSSAGAPDGEPRGLRDAASPLDGGAPWPDADAGRDRPPPERREGRQPDREPGSDAEAHPRSATEAPNQADRVSALRRDDPGEWSCPACGCREVEPQTVLDCFVGSGTTALVARKHGRRCIGIDLSAEYLAIAAKRTQQLSLLGGEL